MADDLKERLSNGPVEFSLDVQRFAVEESTPIEDASIEWEIPFESVGELIIPKQNLDAAPGASGAAQQNSAFSPWHHDVERSSEPFMYPLGNMNRARNPVYIVRASAGGR